MSILNKIGLALFIIGSLGLFLFLVYYGIYLQFGPPAAFIFILINIMILGGFLISMQFGLPAAIIFILINIMILGGCLISITGNIN